MSRRRIPLPVKLGVAVTLAAAGVTAGSLAAIAVSNAEGVYVAGDEVGTAWEATASMDGPALPGGYDWPNESPIKTDAKAQVDVSVLASTRAFYWMCAWEDSYLSGKSLKAQSEALEALPRLGEFPAMADSTNDVETWISNVVKPALAGDSAPIRAEYQASCGAFDPYFPAED